MSAAQTPQSVLASLTTFLRSKGLNPTAIAGVEGNLQIESGFNPAASNPGEGAIGLAQWERGRRTALDAYASRTGGSETSLATQEGYLWQELSQSYPQALSGIQSAQTPTQAATIFDQIFEGSTAASLPARQAAAEALFRGGTANSTSGPGSSSTATDTGLSIPNPFNLPGDAAGAVGDAITGALDAVAKPLFTFALDAALIIFGLIFVVVGLVILSHGGDSSSASSSSPAASPKQETPEAEAAEVAA